MHNQYKCIFWSFSLQMQTWNARMPWLVLDSYFPSACPKVGWGFSHCCPSFIIDSTSVNMRFLPDMWKAWRSNKRLMEINFYSSVLSPKRWYVHTGLALNENAWIYSICLVLNNYHEWSILKCKSIQTHHALNAFVINFSW